MKCDEARLSLDMPRRQFALRYFHWSLAECGREVDSGFARIRRFPSSTSFRFLDFVESLPGERAREQARDLMSANIKFHDAAVAGLGDAGMTDSERELRQRFLNMRSALRTLQGRLIETAYVSPREQDLMQRDLDGETRLWEQVDRKAFMAVLRKHLDTLLGPPRGVPPARSTIALQSVAGTCAATSILADAFSSPARNGSKRGASRIFAHARFPMTSTCSAGAACIRRCAPIWSKPTAWTRLQPCWAKSFPTCCRRLRPGWRASITIFPKKSRTPTRG